MPDGGTLSGMAKRLRLPHGTVPTEAEYERLLDQADIAAGNKAMVAIAAGRDELVPAEVVDRILDGENKVRVWRTHRGMSAQDLAQAADLSAPYISEIESERKEGSISAMKKIAAALKVDLDDLV